MKKLYTIFAVAILLAAFGCSGGSVSPVETAVNESPRIVESGHMPLGLWQFTADPGNESLDAVPLRMGEMHLNALHFLEPPPYLYLTVENLHFSGNVIDVDVVLRHPFLGLNQYTGFDVCGILISNGSVTGFTDPALRMAGDGDTRLLNPDGFTRWWNPAEFPHADTMLGYKDGLLGYPDSEADFNSTLNAYKFFCDDLTEPDMPLGNIDISSRCVFSAGQENTRHYTIELGSDGLVFNYAVDASWKFPTGTPPYDVPGDFAAEANRIEAWNINVTEQSNTLWNNGSGSGGTLSLDVEIWDHYSAEINELYLESPGNFDPVGPITAGAVSQWSAYYDVEIPSATPGPNSIDILITAKSENTGYQGLLPGEPISAYFIYTAEVSTSGTFPPVAIAECISELPYNPGEAISFYAGDSYDPDGGNIVSYEWDFDNDGFYGDSYDSGTDEAPDKIFSDAGIYYIDVRVTDDEAETDTLDELIVINVGVQDDYIWVDDDAVEPYFGTFDNPFPTIAMGLDAADETYPEASHIMVKDGIYDEEVYVELGNVIIEGYSTPAPLIESPEGSVQDLVILGTNADNTTITHFRVKPMTDMRGFYASGSYQVIDDIEFVDNPGGLTCSMGIYIGSWSGTDNIISDVRVDGYHKPDTGFIYAAGTDIQVVDCVLLNITFTGPSVFNVIGVNGNTSSGPHPDLLVARNVIGHITHENTVDDTEWVRAMSCNSVEGGTIRNNLIFDIVNKHTGGWTWGIDCDNSAGVTIEHNTISGLTGPSWIYAMEVGDWNTDPSGVVHRYHIITDLNTTGGMQSWRWAFLGHWSAELPVDYSCAYDVGNAFYDIYEVVEGVGFITSNPQFINPALDDYRVTPGSPADEMGAYTGPDPLTWLPE